MAHQFRTIRKFFKVIRWRESRKVRRVEILVLFQLTNQLVVGHKKAIFITRAYRMLDHQFPKNCAKLSRPLIEVFYGFTDMRHSTSPDEHSTWIFYEWNFLRVNKAKRLLGFEVGLETFKQCRLVLPFLDPLCFETHFGFSVRVDVEPVFLTFLLQ